MTEQKPTKKLRAGALVITPQEMHATATPTDPGAGVDISQVNPSTSASPGTGVSKRYTPCWDKRANPYITIELSPLTYGFDSFEEAKGSLIKQLEERIIEIRELVETDDWKVTTRPR